MLKDKKKISQFMSIIAYSKKIGEDITKEVKNTSNNKNKKKGLPNTNLVLQYQYYPYAHFLTGFSKLKASRKLQYLLPPFDNSCRGSS
jgi:hypothetical protein